MGRHYKDLTGQTFCRLTVISQLPSMKGDGAIWLCKCTCGNTAEVSSRNLVYGSTRSCGCIRRENLAAIQKKNNIHIKHGLSKNRLYTIWARIRYNCNNYRNKIYFGNGIKVCEDWDNYENGFINFYNWAIENGYSEDKKLYLHRINKSGNFCPENCTWETKSSR